MCEHDLQAIANRVGADDAFLADLNEFPWFALDDYNLTQEEKCALISGNVDWIEAHIGKLDQQVRMRLKWPPEAA